jgi:hypothetical protein
LRRAIVAAQQNSKSFAFLLFKSPIHRMRKYAQLAEVRYTASTNENQLASFDADV